MSYRKQVDQHTYIAAASYSDQWWELKDPRDGSFMGGCSSWYICKAMTKSLDEPPWTPQPCLRIVASKDWDTKFADPLAPNQKWYCKCAAKYMASWGQIVEFSRMNPQTRVMDKIYLTSDVPSWDVEDIRAMDLEKRVRPSSAQELYEKVKQQKPATCEFIVKDEIGHLCIDGQEVFDSLPEFKWRGIYNMA